MHHILLFVVFFISFAVGAFGFGNIIGSLMTRQRGFVIPMLIWAGLLVGGYYLVSINWPDLCLGLYLGYGLSLLSVLGKLPELKKEGESKRK